KNLGSTTWTRTGANPVLLGVKSNKNSSLCDSSWIACNRAALLKESTVAPTETGTFEFSFKTTPWTGTLNEYFNLVSEGRSWMKDIGMYLPVNIKPPTSNWSHVGQHIHLDSSR